MFGSNHEGRPHLWQLFTWFNPSLQRGVPVYAYLNESFLRPCELQVELGGNELIDPQALDSLAQNIEAIDSHRFGQNEPPTPGRRGIQLIFVGNVPDFIADGALQALQQFLEQHRLNDVRITGIKSGSIKLTLSLPEDQAERLCELADSGALDRFGLIDFTYVPLEHEVPATIPGVALEAYYGYLVHRAQFLLGDPSLPVRLDAEQLASETLNSAYGTAETALSHDVTRAAQLACLEKIQDRLLVDSLRTFSVPPGDVDSAHQQNDPTKVPTSGESSEGEAAPGEGRSGNSGIGQFPAQQALEPTTADFVPAGDESPPELSPLKERATELPPTWSDAVPESLPDFGQLERIRYIGHGGMGVVYKAFDRGLGIDVALKTVLPHRLSNPKVVRIFHTEPRSMARLKHPHIVHVYHVHEHEGRPYFTMTLIKGASLDCRLEEFCQAPRRAAELLVKVALAVHHAHERGFLHRDLKPANIMLDVGGEPHVTDFGLAKQTSTGECLVEMPAQMDTVSRVFKGIVGSIQYMSPEQATPGKEARTVSDVYGLGATLYALLTGRPPFQAETVEDTLKLVRDGKPKPPGEIRRGLPRDLEAICLKCLKKKPDDRYGTAKDLADDLERFLRGEPVTARPASALRKLWMWACRRPAQAIAASLTALFLVALLAVGNFAWRDHIAHETHLADTIDKALTAAMSGDLDAADQAVADAERAGASTGQVHMLRGQIALHRGKSQDARQHLEEAVRLLPKSVAARGMLAAAYAYDGDWVRYDQMIQEMEQLTPSTPEDFLFKGYAEANLDPALGLQTITQAFDRRPMMGIAARLLRAEVRAFVAQDTDDLGEAEGAVQDAKYAKESLPNNPAALWVSLEAHLAKAGVHEHRDEPKQREAELELAGKDADELKRFTELPEAVVYRWLYFREVRKEEEVLDELRQASRDTDHVYVTFCCALTLYRRGNPGDFEEALGVLEKRHRTYNDRLRPFVLAELDHPNKHDWPSRAKKATEDFAAWSQDGAAIMDTQTVLCLLRKKEDAVKASKKLKSEPSRFYTLRSKPLQLCLDYNAGDLTADELLKGAGHSRWDQCLAHFYIAMTKLAEGDRSGAREHFDKAIKTRAIGWGVYDMSWVFQARLAKDPNWPPWIPNGPAK
jgi:tetratricopeptide (TPR) repeat protein